ncbi:MAG: restriction endonuclease subunit S, partial [Bacteroidales bacterium]|nr:restriction endonuclease subunit S [Bacteroidales bacterium]
NDAVTGKINCLNNCQNQDLQDEKITQDLNQMSESGFTRFEDKQDVVKSCKSYNPQNPDSDRKMKPSGIEWLGDIPEHWEVIKLTGVCGFVRGNSSFKKDELLSEGKYVALQYGKTYKVDEVDEKYQFYVNDEFFKDSQIVNYGDVIIISTSETIEDLGHSVFYNRLDLGLLGGEQILIRPKIEKVLGKYLLYSSKVFAKELKKYATGVKVYRFNISDIRTICTPVPSIEEQQQIVSYIEKETAKLNQTISTIKKEIALVEEYKTALIAEAVTGKIDVREYCLNQDVEGLEDEQDFEEETAYVNENDDLTLAAEMEGDYGT